MKRDAGVGVGVAFLIFGALLWLGGNQLVGQCRADLNPFTGTGTCSGLPVIAYHLQGAITLVSVILAAVGLIMLLTNR